MRQKYLDAMRAWAAEFRRVLHAHRDDLDEGNEDCSSGRCSPRWPAWARAPSTPPRLLGGAREYVAEWTALVQEIEPGLDAATARLRVQIGLKVVTDLLRTPHVARHASAGENVAAVVYALLVSTTR